MIMLYVILLLVAKHSVVIMINTSQSACFVLPLTHLYIAVHFNGVSGFIRTRSLFGEEYCYIMDAKSVGNLGRYLNVRPAVFC